MEFPPCPVCRDGRLLPFLSDSATSWICSAPSCSYALSTEDVVTYYKGTARAAQKEKEGKKFVEYEL